MRSTHPASSTRDGPDGAEDAGTAAFWAGVRAGGTLAVGYLPFGLALGATIAATDVHPVVGWASSWLVFAGAAQVAAVLMLHSGAALTFIIAAGLVINARHLLYGASLAPHVQAWPKRWQWAAAYFLADPVYALVIRRYEARSGDESPRSRRGYYFGVGLSAWTAWQILTGAGVVLADVLPSALPLGLAAPLTFLLLLLPTLTTGPAYTAAGVGGSVALLASGLPLGLGLLVGALAGMSAGVWMEARRA